MEAVQSQMSQQVEEEGSLWSVRLPMNRHGVGSGGLKGICMVPSGTAVAVSLVVAWRAESESIDLTANEIGL
jgi:hypothetical protein